MPEPSAIERVVQAIVAQGPALSLLGAAAFFIVLNVNGRVRKLERQMAEQKADVEVVR